MIEPLSWPPEWKGKSPRKSLLSGLPFIGPEQKAYKFVAKQLESRASSALELWGKNAERRKLADYCSDLFRAELGWPNGLFIPQDPFEIVSWDRFSTVVDELRIPSIISKIEQHVGIQPLWDEWWSESSKLTYGEVIDRLQALATVP